MNKTFGEQLRAHREAHGWTRNQLAHRAHCAAVTVQKLERDERQPSLNLARQLAEALSLAAPQQTHFLAAARPNEQQVADLPSAPSLAVAPDALIARDAELAQIGELLTSDEHRLLTLTGTGGVGKTRLARAAADALATHFADGVYSVELAALRHPYLLLDAVAQAISCVGKDTVPLLERLTAFLHDKQLLLYLDNLEHLLDEKQRLAELLTSCPRLSILITSREATHLPDETVLTLQPLALPSLRMNVSVGDGDALLTAAEASPAVALFTARARESQPSFALTAQNVEAVVQLCTRLDGLPLALELVAARVRLMSPQMLLDRFTSSAGQPRIGLLAQPGATLPGGSPARQRTLHETLDWSYRLLNSAEQNAFCRLSLFAGGCTLEAAEALLHDEQTQPDHASLHAWDLLASLLDKHLLYQREAGGEPRFWMLETIREYASEQLAAAGDVEKQLRRHAAYYADVATHLSKQVYAGVDAERWLAEMEREHANFRVALGGSIARGEGELAMGMATSLWRFWWLRAHWREARNWFEQTLSLFDRSSRGSSVWARGLRAAGTLYVMYGDLATARGYLEESLNLAQAIGDEEVEALAYSSLSSLACDEGDYDQAEALMQRKLDYDLRMEDEHNLAISYAKLGEITLHREEYASGVRYTQQALALQRELGDRPSIMISSVNLAHGLAQQTQHEQALLHLEEALSLARSLHSQLGEVTTLQSMADIYFATDRIALSFQTLAEALTVAKSHGMHQKLGDLLRAVGEKLLRQGDMPGGVHLLGAALAAERMWAIQLEAVDRQQIEQTLAALYETAERATAERAYRGGVNTNADEAVERALRICQERGTESL